jgi:hypothetical protein
MPWHLAAATDFFAGLHAPVHPRERRVLIEKLALTIATYDPIDQQMRQQATAEARRDWTESPVKKASFKRLPFAAQFLRTTVHGSTGSLSLDPNGWIGRVIGRNFLDLIGAVGFPIALSELSGLPGYFYDTLDAFNGRAAVVFAWL